MKELQKIIEQASTLFAKGKKCVLATIVDIEGSGYRRKGTRMLISEDGEFTGAISGGCVEKEVWLQSESVFKENVPKLITYDGRYRLGCEGVLYILIEPILINQQLLTSFKEAYSWRIDVTLTSYFNGERESNENSGTVLSIQGLDYKLDNSNETHFKSQSKKFVQKVKPVKSLIIFGSEHDAVTLTKFASLAGWGVTVVAHPLNQKSIEYFPGALEVIHLLPEETNQLGFDNQTACLFMSHSFSRDLSYLNAVTAQKISYIGLLGPRKRKEQLLHKLIEMNPEISTEFLDRIYGPVGLDIGAETPQEIAISILAELQAVFTQTKVDHLHNKTGSIHQRV